MKSYQYKCILIYIFSYGSVVQSNNYWKYSYNPFIFYRPLTIFDESCVYTNDIPLKFSQDNLEFLVPVFLKLASESKQHFLISPVSMWLSLAAIAEGSVGIAKQELFELLKLPEDKCLREKYYAFANSLEKSKNGVPIFSTKRMFFVDESLLLNKDWEHIVNSNGLTQVVRLPLNNNSEESLDAIRHVTSTQLLNIDLNGNSLLLDTLDHKVSWNTVFLGATIEKVPFYNDFGEEIGTVNMIKMKKRVKVAYLPELNYKIIELPVGHKSQYRLLLGTTHGIGSNLKKTFGSLESDVIQNIKKAYRFSKVPIDIGIPQYSATTEIDVRSILEKLGVKTVWNDTYATRNISYPPAIPSGFVQRVTLTIDGPARPLITEIRNIVPALDDMEDEDTGLDVEIGREFILNKPFLLGLFDAETYTCLFTSTFSIPGLNKE